MEKARKSFIELALKYRQITITIVVILCLIGVYALANMQRQEFPDFKIRQGLVVAVFPGASSRQADEQVAKPLQEYLFGFKEVRRDRTYSESKDGQVVVYVEVNEDVKDPDMFWNKLRLGLKELKAKLPPQVAVLIGTNDFGDASAVLFAVSSKNRTYRELEYYTDKLENEIRRNEAVSKVKDYGRQKERITVYLSPAKLAHYGIRPEMVASSLNLEGMLGLGGTVKTADTEYPVRLPERFSSESEVADQIIYASPDNKIVRVKDVARVVREYDLDTSYVESNGVHSLVVSMEMRYGFNIVKFGKDVDKIIKEFKSSNPSDIEIVKVADMPGVVRHSINHFFGDFTLAIVSVILVCMILLPRRIAAVASLAVPICILISLGIMQKLGIGLDTVSLATLVVVLGMVVDNAIVVIDNHVEKLDHGVDVWTSAWSSARELAVPVFTATLAIIAAFGPMSAFLTGTAKDFLGPIPPTVAITMTISFIVAMIFVPVLSYAFIKTGLHGSQKKAGAGGRPSMLDRLQAFYDKHISKTMSHPGKTIGLGVAAIIVGIILTMMIPQQLFPTLERNQFAAEIYFPEGTTLEANSAVTKKMSAALLKDSRVSDVISFIGTSSPRFHSLYAPQIAAKNYSQLIVLTKTQDDTIKVLHEYDKKYRDAFPNAHIRWKQLSFLNSESPVEIYVSGDSIETARETAEKIKKAVSKVDGIIWLRDDIRESRTAIDLDINREAADRLGLTRGLIGLSTALNNNGLPVATVWDGDYARQVLMKYEKNSVASPKGLADQYVNSPMSPYGVLMRQVAKPKPGFTEGRVGRRNGRPTVTISVDVAFGQLASSVQSSVEKIIDNMKLPEEIHINYGGEKERLSETFVPMTYGLLLSLLFIFLILLFQFKTIRLALVIMGTMPLSMFSAALGMLIMGYPFGITAFCGFIGLFGIVVRNGIILISYAEELIHSGMSVRDAALAAGKRRLRPIFLTASAAAVGVIPLITSGSLLWGPLGTVICFGLIGSTFFTLLVLPVVYWKLGGEKSEPALESLK